MALHSLSVLLLLVMQASTDLTKPEQHGARIQAVRSKHMMRGQILMTTLSPEQPPQPWWMCRPG